MTWAVLSVRRLTSHCLCFQHLPDRRGDSMIPPWLLNRDANLVRLLLRGQVEGAVGLVHRVGFSRRCDQIPGGASRLLLRGVPCFEHWGTALPHHNGHARSEPGRRFCNRRRCVFSLLSPFPRDQSGEKDVESRQRAGRPPRTPHQAEPDSVTPNDSFTSYPHVHIYPHALNRTI